MERGFIMNNLNIGKQLKKIRQGRELSLDEAAVLTEVSKPMLGQIERGQSSPTITTLWKIATGLKVPLFGRRFIRAKRSIRRKWRYESKHTVSV